MKKNIIVISLSVFIIFICTFITNKVYASENKVISSNTESQIVEMKEKELSSMQDYEEEYGSKTYGTVAYVLHIVQFFSIPLCFLGIIIGAIYDYVLGTRHLEVKEKGLAWMVTCITLGIICQVLPLVFTIVVKFGRE